MSTNGIDTRPSPEAMLKLANAEEVTADLGKLKIFLGYAAGVGKTYAMPVSYTHLTLPTIYSV